jgi:Fe-S cluster assembly scaffold protein SufB
MLFFLTARGVEKEHALEMLVLGKVTSFLGDTIPEILLHSFQRAISTLAGLSKKR